MDTATTVDTSYWLTTFTCIKGAQNLVLRIGRDKKKWRVFIAGQLPINVNQLKEIRLLVITLGKLLPIPQVVEAVSLGETLQKRTESF